MLPCPRYSIIVPAYNRSDLSRQVLTDITGNLEPDTEIIFVDDGSTDDTPSIQQQFKHVRYIRHDQNRGVSPAWNTGVEAAKGDYTLIVNNDVRISDSSWCSKLVGAMQNGKVITGPEFVDYNSWAAYKGRNTPYINGWCYAFPRRLFSEIGLFDEAFAPASYEDVDICSRAAAAGYTLKQVDLRMQHSVSQTVNKYLRGDMPRLNQRNKEIWLTKMAALDRPRMKIVFDCASNGRKWGPHTLEESGLGGAETAITLLSRELVSRGHEVLIFNDFEHGNGQEGEGVKYYHRRDVPQHGLDCDVFVAFRCPSEHLSQSSAPAKIFWSCDQQTTPPATWDRDLFPVVDVTVCISTYHREYLARRHGQQLPFVVIPCPVRSWDYEPHLNKDENLFVFCSVPHRGLMYMPMVMAEIRKELPEARLVITSDYRLWGAPDPRNAEFRANPMLAREEFLGMIPRSDLIRLQSQAMGQPYPCTYEELFCVAIAECATAGAVPVSTTIGSVPETLGDPSRIVGPPVGAFAQDVGRKMLEVYSDRDIMRQTIEQSWRFSVVEVGNQWEELCYSLLGQPRATAGTAEAPFASSPSAKVYPAGDRVSYTPSA